ncbi:hypothetical protein ZWY2020_054015 [Hordeum vulgare]|nr:hypothetical protein ZWY2020_054015 [Hordeum vulgare]
MQVAASLADRSRLPISGCTSVMYLGQKGHMFKYPDAGKKSGSPVEVTAVDCKVSARRPPVGLRSPLPPAQI